MVDYISTHLIDVAALVLLFCLVYGNNILQQNRKGPFYVGIILTILIILSEVGTIVAGNGNYNFRLTNIICKVLGFALAPLIPLTLIAVFDLDIFKTKKILMFPSLLNVIATALSPWLGLIFYVDTYNYYERGSFFFIFLIAYLINFLILIIGTLSATGKHCHPMKLKIITLLLFTIIGTSLQLILPSIYSTWHSVTLSLLLYYFLLSDFDGSFDTLTRFHNRSAYEKIARTLDGRKSYSIIILDINTFKEINDTYGHDFGDTVLKKVAGVITKSFDSRCTYYRVGGDEFTIINSTTDLVTLENQLKIMTNNLEKERQNDSRLPTIAYGYCVFKGGKDTSFQQVVNEADRQMYHCKEMQKKQNQGISLEHSNHG